MALGVPLFFPCSFKVTCMSSHVINMCLEKICAMKMLLTFFTAKSETFAPSGLYDSDVSEFSPFLGKNALKICLGT